MYGYVCKKMYCVKCKRVTDTKRNSTVAFVSKNASATEVFLAHTGALQVRLLF